MAGIEGSLLRTPHRSSAERVSLRLIGPPDADALQAYIRRLSQESRYNRFFAALRELPRTELDRLTHLDRKYQLALLAEAKVDGAPTMIAEACYMFIPDRREAEFALSVADGWRREGLGTLLVADIERRTEDLGARRLVGEVLRSNGPMQALARKAGFLVAADMPRDTRLVRIEKGLARSQDSLASNAIAWRRRECCAR